MKVILRGHHLVCLRFYDGTGYEERFREELRAVVAGASQHGVWVGEGVDDLCIHCPSVRQGRCADTPTADEEVRAMDRVALTLLGLRPGETVWWGELGQRIPGFFPRWQAEFCDVCAWRGGCEGSDAYKKLCQGSR